MNEKWVEWEEENGQNASELNTTPQRQRVFPYSH